jgi:hypothetical protein
VFRGRGSHHPPAQPFPRFRYRVISLAAQTFATLAAAAPARRDAALACVAALGDRARGSRIDCRAEFGERDAEGVEDASDRGPGGVDLAAFDAGVGGDAEAGVVGERLLPDAAGLAERAEGGGEGGVDAGAGRHTG